MLSFCHWHGLKMCLLKIGLVWCRGERKLDCLLYWKIRGGCCLPQKDAPAAFGALLLQSRAWANQSKTTRPTGVARRTEGSSGFVTAACLPQLATSTSTSTSPKQATPTLDTLLHHYHRPTLRFAVHAYKEGRFDYIGVLKSHLYILPVAAIMPGFDFSNYNRNAALHARGVPLPKATSTGTTIVGCIFDGGVVVSTASSQSLCSLWPVELLHHLIPTAQTPHS